MLIDTLWYFRFSFVQLQALARTLISLSLSKSENRLLVGSSNPLARQSSAFRFSLSGCRR
ncbi:hypothetical protein ACH0BF_07785 [Pseudobacillus sp. 179-B 2D1 NHS]|uniref:hypothetical protein n=1 Tax=Pseudobacillus sp. 179-B 2D1 NHS TaxID=3374292 RepID=UPI003879B1DC